jgi:hypothetical protein
MFGRQSYLGLNKIGLRRNALRSIMGESSKSLVQGNREPAQIQVR